LRYRIAAAAAVVIIFIVGHQQYMTYIKTCANITQQHNKKERKTKNKIVAESAPPQKIKK